jgi:ABC-2 type transport system permease protein
MAQQAEARIPNLGVTGASRSTAVAALMQRELSGLFFSPIAYIVGFVFLVLSGMYFTTDVLQAGNEASMAVLFERIAGLLVFALPLLTMRSVADEFASGSIETLMTAPVTDAGVILGKFAGVMIFYVGLLATTVPHLILMSVYADPVGTEVVSGYIGLILLGAMFTAVGLFASSCTRHQLLAAVIGVTVLSLFSFAAEYASEQVRAGWLRSFFSSLNILEQFSDCNKGMIDLGSVVFFLTNTGMFLFLAVKVLESRRWR